MLCPKQGEPDSSPLDKPNRLWTTPGTVGILAGGESARPKAVSR